MSRHLYEEISPGEVKQQLEYLGYTNITKEQLISFIRDLKKLIKHEERKIGRLEGSEQTNNSGESSAAVVCHSSSARVCCTQDRSCHSLTAARVCCCQSSSAPARRTYHNSSEEASCLSSTAARAYQCSAAAVCQSSGPAEDSQQERSYHPEHYLADVEELCETSAAAPDEKSCRLRPVAPRKQTKDERKPLQPIPSFIREGCGGGGGEGRTGWRARRRELGGKCDPVALYQYYQREWSKRPLPPGEDLRAGLRWAVRSRLARMQQEAENSAPASQSRFTQRKEWVSS